MGSNDAREMLEVAQEECIRLERALALAERHSDRDRADMLLIAGQRDAALAVIEQVRAEANACRSIVTEGLVTPDVASAFDLMARGLTPILAQSSASALAKVKADAWDEGFERAQALWPSGERYTPVNPYRTEATGA